MKPIELDSPPCTFFLTVVPVNSQDVIMQAARSASGPDLYQTPPRAWEYCRYHLLHNAGVEDKRQLEEADSLLQQNRPVKFHEVWLTETQLRQMGFEPIKSVG
jgi:hypothetical protein